MRILIVLAFLAACSDLRTLRELGRPAGPLDERMNRLIGKSLKDLNALYGPPANATDLPDRRRILQYPAEQEGGRETRATYDAQSRTWVVWPRPSSCPTAFTVSPKGIIESWSAEGRDCR